MVFKLSREESNERSAYVGQLQEAHSRLEDAVNEFNTKLSEIRGPMQEAIDAYLTLAGEVETWVENLTSEKRSEFDEKSERWQDGDRGQAADSWLCEWESFSSDDLGIELPVDIDISSFTCASEPLSELPEEPEPV